MDNLTEVLKAIQWFALVVLLGRPDDDKGA
jgi:hypothetical protein